MTAAYLDTSTLGRIATDRREAPAILRELARFDKRVSSRLLKVELTRLCAREGRLDRVRELLTGVALLPVDDSLLTVAEAVAPVNVGTLDAIHLVTALKLESHQVSTVMLTYDKTLAAAAQHHGLTVLSPT